MNGEITVIFELHAKQRRDQDKDSTQMYSGIAGNSKHAQELLRGDNGRITMDEGFFVNSIGCRSRADHHQRAAYYVGST